MVQRKCTGHEIVGCRTVDSPLDRSDVVSTNRVQHTSRNSPFAGTLVAAYPVSVRVRNLTGVRSLGDVRSLLGDRAALGVEAARELATD